MLLDEECKGCLYKSQLKKVARDRGGNTGEFERGVKQLCENPPADYCAPLLMRDINALHKKLYGCDIDYSKEKKLFNDALLSLENELCLQAENSGDPLKQALKLTMASNFIDFARKSDLDESAVSYVLETAERAEPDKKAYSAFKEKLSSARSLCVLHDNCGEIVLDKILIRIIKKLYPRVEIFSVVRGQPIINDATCADAEYIGLNKYAEIIPNGSNVPGTYLKEISERAMHALKTSDIILSKGLGNLETLYGEGFGAFYSFTCKCEHIAKRFSMPLLSAGFIREL